MVAHVKFIESHHRQIQKLAVVSDNSLLKELPRIVSQLVQPEVKHFSESERENALRWLKEAPKQAK